MRRFLQCSDSEACMAKSLKQAYDYWQNRPDLNWVVSQPLRAYTLSPKGKRARAHAGPDGIDDRDGIIRGSPSHAQQTHSHSHTSSRCWSGGRREEERGAAGRTGHEHTQ
ncbi:unnamed protein product [Phytomonas sp. Hart1]|nr:unnamed protein product [Phytomonas sp. Hart1]|eukprot:CCW72291.1 unnamed protein product [Phytomonas sp. isolate Hart1]